MSRCGSKNSISSDFHMTHWYTLFSDSFFINSHMRSTCTGELTEWELVEQWLDKQCDCSDSSEQQSRVWILSVNWFMQLMSMWLMFCYLFSCLSIQFRHFLYSSSTFFLLNSALIDSLSVFFINSELSPWFDCIILSSSSSSVWGSALARLWRSNNSLRVLSAWFWDINFDLFADSIETAENQLIEFYVSGLSLWRFCRAGYRAHWL